jgi:hypothetical protein
MLRPFYEPTILQPSIHQSLQLDLRPIILTDCQAINSAFTAQGWDKPVSLYERYVNLQNSGARDVIIATVNEKFAGYLTIMWNSGYPPFQEQCVPEIVDFNVLMKYWRKGIGTSLMDEAERRVALVSPVAGIGVGVTGDYGAAQVLYSHRGYVPTGHGLVHNGLPLRRGQRVEVGDELAFYLTKSLT